MKVGWIGLGGIGKEMALRVLGAGHDLTAYDRGAGKAEVAASGGKMIADYGVVASTCDVLCLCLFNDDQVRPVGCFGGELGVDQVGSPAQNLLFQMVAMANKLGFGSLSLVDVD